MQAKPSRRRSRASLTEPDSQSVAALPAITTPIVDAICIGGLALVVITGVLIVFGVAAPEVAFVFPMPLIFVSELLINGPHFMASYKLLYQKRKNLTEHKYVSYVIPAALVLFIPFGVWQSIQYPDSLTVYKVTEMTLLPLLLAWHYTGQAWGMTSCFAFLGGLKMSDQERWMIRSGMRALIFYHLMVWWSASKSINYLGLDPEVAEGLVTAAMTACRLLVFATFALGLIGFRNLSKREGKPIPIRCWLPWAAIFGWYVMYDMIPATFVLLQIFHAIQYLIFPMRVEINQHNTVAGSSHRIRHIIFYYLLLVALAFVAFVALPVVELVQSWPFKLTIFIALAINIHHYFIDSVIWKIRDPEVRESLFGHLTPSTSN